MSDVSLLDLWAPILTAWIVVHILSTLAWIALPHHKPEWIHLPLVGPLDEAIRSADTQPGKQYMLTEETEGFTNPAKCRGMLILWKHTPSMGANIGMTLGFFLLAAIAIGYLASIGLRQASTSLDIFRFTATAAFLTHALAGVPTVIWFRRKFLMDFVDGIAYSLATGASFALLWPY